MGESTVGISFDKAHPLLVKLKVENEKMLMNLSSSYVEDSDLIFLSAVLLKKLFNERIATHDDIFKKLVENDFNITTITKREDQSEPVRSGINAAINNFDINNIT